MTDDEFSKIYEEANRVAAAEYREAIDKLQETQRTMQDQMLAWQGVVGRIQQYYGNHYNMVTQEGLDEFLVNLEKLVRTGIDFERLNKAAENNEVVQKAWSNLLMALRLTGMDNSTPGSENE